MTNILVYLSQVSPFHPTFEFEVTGASVPVEFFPENIRMGWGWIPFPGLASIECCSNKLLRAEITSEQHPSN